MKRTFSVCIFATVIYVTSSAGQVPSHPGPPIYRVTVIERSTKAVNYQYRTGPTRIDFAGTVLLPQAKGSATVESLRGRTEIEAKFENLTPPTKYGREYLTYTLWAISPEGGAHNLGELIADGSNKAKVHVSTALQAFGMIVTAEPYSTARQPSDVVVMENEVRADTAGKVQTIDAKYELLPRGQYTYDTSANLTSTEGLPKVSMDKYEALLELYQAQNAVGIARAAKADTLAASTFQKAQSLLEQAQQLQSSGASSKVVVENAKEAAQTAEDARLIAERRRQDEAVAQSENAAISAQQAQTAALQSAQQAQAEASSAKAEAEAERLARIRAEAEAAELRNRANRAEANVAHRAATLPAPAPTKAPDTGKLEFRMRLYDRLNSVLPTRDTPRGLVATVSDSGFRGVQLRDSVAAQVSRLGAMLDQNRELRVEVEGYADAGSRVNTAARAEAVRRMLVAAGIEADRVAARGMGDARPLASNSSAMGRQENRRVEIVISGEAIGTLPFWDRKYSVAPGSGMR